MVSPGPPKSATLHGLLALCFHLLYRQGKEFHNSKWGSFSEMESADAGQIHADGRKDKQTAQELERPCLAKHSRVVEALVPRACESETLGKTPSAAAPVPSSLGFGCSDFNLRPSFHLRIVAFTGCPGVPGARHSARKCLSRAQAALFREWAPARTGPGPFKRRRASATLNPQLSTA